MRNLIELITRYGHILLFLFLEIICFFIIINYNTTQNDIWANTTSIFSDGINARIKSFSNYSRLQTINDSLRSENAQLLEKIVNYRVFERDNNFTAFEKDSSITQYQLIPVSICNKTTHLRNNNLTLCQGKEEGIGGQMGLISDKGVIGMTSACSANYCKALLVTNSLTRVSAMIKNKNFTGNISWQNNDPRILTMNAVPKYAKVVLGDTIVTSGYSTMFPPGIPIGLISKYKLVPGQNELEIEVAMLEDVTKLTHAYVIEFIHAEEKENVVLESIDE